MSFHNGINLMIRYWVYFHMSLITYQSDALNVKNPCTNVNSLKKIQFKFDFQEHHEVKINVNCLFNLKLNEINEQKYGNDYWNRADYHRTTSSKLAVRNAAPTKNSLKLNKLKLKSTAKLNLRYSKALARAIPTITHLVALHDCLSLKQLHNVWYENFLLLSMKCAQRVIN